MTIDEEEVDVNADVHQVNHGKKIDWYCEEESRFYLDLVHHHMKIVDHHENIIIVLDHIHVQKKKVNVNVVHHQVDHQQQKRSKLIHFP